MNNGQHNDPVTSQPTSSQHSSTGPASTGPASTGPAEIKVLRVPAAGVMLEAELCVPERPAGLVMISPGVAGARRRPHVRATSARLAEAGWATAVLELLTPEEEALDEVAVQRRLDIGLLAGRVAGVLDRLGEVGDMGRLPVGLMGAGRGAAAALLTASRRPSSVRAVVSRGLRIGLGGDTLSHVTAATLLITSDEGPTARDVARQTADRLGGEHELRVVDDADGRFLETNALDAVLDLTRDWFARHLHDAA